MNFKTRLDFTHFFVCIHHGPDLVLYMQKKSMSYLKTVTYFASFETIKLVL